MGALGQVIVLRAVMNISVKLFQIPILESFTLPIYAPDCHEAFCCGRSFHCSHRLVEEILAVSHRRVHLVLQSHLRDDPVKQN